MVDDGVVRAVLGGNIFSGSIVALVPIDNAFNRCTHYGCNHHAAGYLRHDEPSNFGSDLTQFLADGGGALYRVHPFMERVSDFLEESTLEYSSSDFAGRVIDVEVYASPEVCKIKLAQYVHRGAVLR